MAVALLGTNLLMALGWPPHIHYDAAHRWLAANRELVGLRAQAAIELL